MATNNFRPEPPIRGSLIIEEEFPNCVDVFFIPPEELMWEGKQGQKKAQLLWMNGQDDYLIIYPLNTLPGHPNFLAKKYSKLISIELEGFSLGIGETEDEVADVLNRLPEGLGRDFNYGLGFLKSYTPLFHVLEDISDCSSLVISKNNQSSYDKTSSSLVLQFYDYLNLLGESDKISNRANYVSLTERKRLAQNIFGPLLGLEKKPLKGKKDFIRNAIVDGIEDWEVPTRAKAAEAMEVALEADTPLSAEEHHKLLKLQDKIELVTLKQLINLFEASLTGRNAGKEDFWQDMFSQNPFILSQAFGYTIVKLGEKVTVGGRGLDGSGDKITDFLTKNACTANTAIVEIKTPKTKLLGATPYRGGVYSPHAKFSGAVSQILDQRFQFQTEINSLKAKARNERFESYWVRCCLIIGTLPDGDDQQKSFELCRGNFKDVDVITFDELLEKLKELCAFLSDAVPPEKILLEEDGLPELEDL